MHIGYFTHSAIAISETFIADLIQALHLRAERLTVYSGATSTPTFSGVDIRATGYHTLAEARGNRLYQVGQVMGRRGDLLRFNHARALAQRILRREAEVLAGMDAVYVDYGISAALLAPLFASYQIPFVVHVHGFDVSAAFASAAYTTAFIAACHQAHAIVAPSHHLRRLLILAGAPADRIHVAPYGVSAREIEPLSWKKRLAGAPTLVHLGRLTDKKHPIAVLHALERVRQYVPDVRLDMIGDGPLRGEVERRVQQLGLSEAVTLHGALPRSASFPILNRAQVFVQHSVTSIHGDQEGFPVSPAEAALHGLPIVATAHSGLSENVVDGETGYLVPEHNFEAMADRIVHLLRHPELAERMGQAGRRRILALCNPDERADRILSLLQQAGRQHTPAADPVHILPF